eukprot:629093-Prorocentrum_minimum.AAC.1
MGRARGGRNPRFRVRVEECVLPEVVCCVIKTKFVATKLKQCAGEPPPGARARFAAAHHVSPGHSRGATWRGVPAGA